MYVASQFGVNPGTVVGQACSVGVALIMLLLWNNVPS